MNIHLAMSHVATMLDACERDHAVVVSPVEREAIQTLLDELLFMRERAQALNLLNLIAERKLSSISNIPPPPETEPALPADDDAPPRGEVEGEILADKIESRTSWD